MHDRFPMLVRSHWDGEHWRWWTLAGGVFLVPLSAVLAVAIAVLTGERILPLLLMLLIIEILVISMIGSGVFESMTSRMTRGGLTREATDYVNRAEAEIEAIEERNRQAKDRRTIRAGIAVVPLIVSFVVLLTQT